MTTHCSQLLLGCFWDDFRIFWQSVGAVLELLFEMNSDKPAFVGMCLVGFICQPFRPHDRASPRSLIAFYPFFADAAYGPARTHSLVAHPKLWILVSICASPGPQHLMGFQYCRRRLLIQSSSMTAAMDWSSKED